jgi:hypothetical protein
MVFGAKLQAPKLKTVLVHLWRDEQIKPLADAIEKSPWAKKLTSFRIVHQRGDQYLVKLLRAALEERGVKRKVETGKDTET